VGKESKEVLRRCGETHSISTRLSTEAKHGVVSLSTYRRYINKCIYLSIYLSLTTLAVFSFILSFGKYSGRSHWVKALSQRRIWTDCNEPSSVFVSTSCRKYIWHYS